MSARFLRLHFSGDSGQHILVNTATIIHITEDDEERGSRIEFNNAVADTGMGADFVIVKESLDDIERMLAKDEVAK